MPSTALGTWKTLNECHGVEDTGLRIQVLETSCAHLELLLTKLPCSHLENMVDDRSCLKESCEGEFGYCR